MTKSSKKWLNGSREIGRRKLYSIPLLALTVLALLLGAGTASAGLIATHRVGAGDTIGDSLQCRNQVISYFGSASAGRITYARLEVRNNSGQLTLFGGEIREEGTNGKVWFLPRFSMGPNPGVKFITVNQSFKYSHNAGFKLTLRSTGNGCGGREESVRFLSQ